ncbi:hypothetical protein HDV00_005963 [Rhizophlyctis rosea]|nr:hypothetical protein HDV00_005963 [Rhizophlyctis rosea]
MSTTLPPIATNQRSSVTGARVNGGVQSSPGTLTDDEKVFGKVVTDLSKKLARRQAPEELVQRNIMREDELQPQVSNSIVQAKMALEEARTKDALGRRIANRPTKVDLKLRNILRVDSSDDIYASGELDNAVNIEERGKALKSCLKKRPERSQLEEMNIIKAGGSLDPSLIAAQQRLKRSQLEDMLSHRLEHRPNVEELQEARILVFSETVEVLPTFRSSEYNRKPDANATFKKLTSQMKVAIREELNTFKKHEMNVHEESAFGGGCLVDYVECATDEVFQLLIGRFTEHLFSLMDGGIVTYWPVLNLERVKGTILETCKTFFNFSMSRRLRNRTIVDEDAEMEEAGPSGTQSQQLTQSQSQSRASLGGASQPRGQTGDEEASSSDDEPAQTQSRNRSEQYLAKMQEEEINKAVKDFVRLALATEHQRQPLRREEISKKVLKEHSRAFDAIFVKAQARLRDVFGLELVLMPSKEKPRGGASQSARRATEDRTPTTSKAYILRSVLPPNTRESVNSWGDEQPLMVLICIILSLIFVHGRSITDACDDCLYTGNLHSLLRRLRINKDYAHPIFGQRDALLTSLCKQGYLEKIKHATNEINMNDMDSEGCEYVWGPRAKVEFTEESVVGFVSDMYPDLEGGVRKRLENDVRSSAGIAMAE